MQAELSLWNAERDLKNTTINWQFISDNARIKLKRLYPVFKD